MTWEKWEIWEFLAARHDIFSKFLKISEQILRKKLKSEDRWQISTDAIIIKKYKK